MVSLRHLRTVLALTQWQCTTVVPPRQSRATVALALWRDTTEVPAPLYSSTGFAVVLPPSHYLRYHGGDSTWCSAASCGTLCTGDVSSAVLTARSGTVVVPTQRLCTHVVPTERLCTNVVAP